MAVDTVVRARIPLDVKEQAQETLHSMGLNTSDLIRMTFIRVAKEGRLPFEVNAPNKATKKAMAELNAGKGKKFDRAEVLFDDLGI